MSQATLVYPFDRQFLPILRHKLLPDDLDVKFLISPNGWGFSGKDAGELDALGNLNIIVESDFQKYLDQCETVLFTKSDIEIREDIRILDKFELAIKNKKNIICTLDLTQEQYQNFISLAHKENCQFIYYNTNLPERQLPDDIFKKRDIMLQKINTPIITVFGLIECLNKFDIQVNLNKFFKYQNYNSVLVSSRSYGSLFGEYSIPCFMFDKKFHLDEKVILFNNFIKTIEQDKQPDVIIIGIPGGLIPLNEKITNYFGMMAYMITRAIEVDSSLLCCYSESYTKKYFEEMNKLCHYRFSADIDAYIIDNTVLDISSQDTYDMLSVSPIEPSHMRIPHPNDCPIPCYTNSTRQDAFELVLKKLEGYAPLQTF